MKKEIIFIFLSVFIISGVFASGQTEENTTEPSFRSGHGMCQYQYLDKDLLELSGTLELINGEAPILNVGSEKYTLMVPYHLLYNLDIKNGEDALVKGIIMPDHMWQWDNSSKALMVTFANIKGEDYDLSRYMGYGMGKGYSNRGTRCGRGCR